MSQAWIYINMYRSRDPAQQVAALMMSSRRWSIRESMLDATTHQKDIIDFQISQRSWSWYLKQGLSPFR